MPIRDEIAARLEARRREAEDADRADARLSNARVAVFLAGVVLAWLLLGPQVLGPGWLLLPATAFFALVLLHERAKDRGRRARRGARFHERALERIDGTWIGKGRTGAEHVDPGHRYADDLDLFGRASVFELLATTRTRAGEAVLARWMKEPGTGAVERREGLKELMPRLDLREELDLLGPEGRDEGDAEKLAAWGAAPPVGVPALLPALAGAAAVANAGAIVAWAAGVSFAWPLGAFVLSLAVHGACRSRASRIVDAVEARGREIGLLAEVFGRLEREEFASDFLRRRREALGAGVARELAGLRKLVDRLDTRRNQLFHPIALAFCWTPLVAFSIERWRLARGRELGAWIGAMAEIEALSALAGYAAEHPEDAWPEFVEGPPRFEAEGLAHPLMPPGKCVPNDVSVGGEGPAVLVVTGSNMSGKSTLLRTVGTNALLARLGLPARAKRLRLSGAELAASIRRTDSLQEGTSRFYAEIARLKLVADLAAAGPVLYLVDEILAGTNSHDRAVGSEAVVKGLLARGAAGLVTTHDLSLAKVADALAPRAANVHFEDHLEGGRMAFDYRLKPGTVTRSNAIGLMRAMGLDV